ncbi:MAG: DUF6090 family protein [Flavobacteriales bacterium]
MIKFFRKIRQQMLSENKFTRYLIYALGEIVLVVIGILIAVGINSWYNTSRNEQKIETILRQVQKELLTDITDAKRITNFHIESDSIARMILDDEFTTEMFLQNPEPAFLSTGYVSFSTMKGGYQRLLNNLENLPERYKVLLPHFNNLHVELQNDIDDFNTRLKNTVHQGRDADRLSNPKLADYHLGKYPEEAADYFVNDPLLKNRTSFYMLDLNQLQMAVNEYRVESTILYQKIDSLLGKKTTDKHGHLSKLPDEMDMQSYLGDYTRIGGTIFYLPTDHEISFGMEGGKLMGYNLKADTTALYWHDDQYFYLNQSFLTLKFYTNEKGQHIHEISDGWQNALYMLKKDQ